MNDFVYLRDADTWYTKSPPTRASPQPTGRALRTLLTDNQIKEGKLLVLTKVNRLDLLDASSDSESSDGQGTRWLVRGAANDEAADKQAEQSWLAIFQSRLDDLRVIATEEGLDFDQASVDAALTLLRRLPLVRQPGTFLVGGNIRLVWDALGGEQVGLQFRGSNKIQFVILQSDGDELGSAMGVKSSDAVLRMLAAPEIRRILTR